MKPYVTNVTLNPYSFFLSLEEEIKEAIVFDKKLIEWMI